MTHFFEDKKMSILDKISKKHLVCIIAFLILIPIAIIITVNIVKAQLAVATLTAQTDYNNPFALANGESIDISIVWNKNVSGLELDDFSYAVFDEDGNGITSDIRIDRSIHLPKVSNFIAIDKQNYKLTFTAPRQIYGRIKKGKIVFNFARKDNSIIGESYDNNILEFTFGNKATCEIFPSRRHLKNGQSMRIALIWDREVQGVNQDDISVDIGHIHNLTRSSSFMQCILRAPDTGSGDMKIILREDACAAGNNEVVMFVSYGSN